MDNTECEQEKKVYEVKTVKFVKWYKTARSNKQLLDNPNCLNGAPLYNELPESLSLKLEFFYQHFIDKAGAGDPLVQFDKEDVYDLGQMVMFKESIKNEDTAYQNMKEVTHWPILRQPEKGTELPLDWKQAGQKNIH